MNIYNKSDVAGNIFEAEEFRCFVCKSDEFVHEGTTSSDGMHCWWHGMCVGCKIHYEIDMETVVYNTKKKWNFC